MGGVSENRLWHSTTACFHKNAKRLQQKGPKKRCYNRKIWCHFNTDVYITDGLELVEMKILRFALGVMQMDSINQHMFTDGGGGGRMEVQMTTQVDSGML